MWLWWRFLKVINLFSLCHYCVPLQNDIRTILKLILSLCQVWLKLTQWVYMKDIFKSCQNNFTLSPLSRGPLLNLKTNLKSRISIAQRCFVPSLFEIWPRGSEEDFFFKVVDVFQFSKSLLSPLGKGCGHPLEKTWIPFTQGYVYRIWLKLAQWFWRSRCKCETFTDKRRTTGDKKSTLGLSYNSGELKRKEEKTQTVFCNFFISFLIRGSNHNVPYTAPLSLQKMTF